MLALIHHLMLLLHSQFLQKSQQHTNNEVPQSLSPPHSSIAEFLNSSISGLKSTARMLDGMTRLLPVVSAECAYNPPIHRCISYRLSVPKQGLKFQTSQNQVIDIKLESNCAVVNDLLAQFNQQPFDCSAGLQPKSLRFSSEASGQMEVQNFSDQSIHLLYRSYDSEPFEGTIELTFKETCYYFEGDDCDSENQCREGCQDIKVKAFSNFNVHTVVSHIEKNRKRKFDLVQLATILVSVTLAVLVGTLVGAYVWNRKRSEWRAPIIKTVNQIQAMKEVATLFELQSDLSPCMMELSQDTGYRDSMQDLSPELKAKP